MERKTFQEKLQRKLHPEKTQVVLIWFSIFYILKRLSSAASNKRQMTFCLLFFISNAKMSVLLRRIDIFNGLERGLH